MLAAAFVAVVALTTVVVTAWPAHAATATFAKDSDWGTGYQGRFTVTNDTSTTITSWRVEFDLAAGSAMGTYWDALLTSNGNHHTFTNRNYNGTLAPGASAVFGFIVNGTATPANCSVNGSPCAGGPPPTSPPPGAPPAPTNLRTTTVTCTSITLAWNASTGATSYDVYQGTTLRTNVTGLTATVPLAAGSNTFTVRARNASGQSGPSNAVTVTPPPCPPPPPAGALPHAPYVDMGAWPTPLLTDLRAGGGLRGFTLAFVTASACKAMWFNAYDPRTGWMKDQVDAIRAAGGDVKISFGGATGIELAQACSTVDSLLGEYQAVVTAYNLKYIDLDIEGAATADPTSVNRRSQALARLQQNNPGLRVSLTLPVLPEGLTADGVNVVRSARDAGVNVDIVNVMAMDYYRDGDYGTFAVQAAQSTFSQLKALYPSRTDAQVWRMVGVTPMLGQNDDGRIYNQGDARQLVQFAQQQHLGVLAFWEMTRDRNACTGALYRCTNIPQTPYEFSQIFAGYTG